MATHKEKMIEVPDAYKMTFKRLLTRVPKKKRHDKKLQETLLMCMKLGGEELTRQRIKLEKVKFAETPDLFKRRIPVIPIEPVDSAPVADEKQTATETTPVVDETVTVAASTPVVEKVETAPEPTKSPEK